MAERRRIHRFIAGLLIGAGLLVGAIVCVFAFQSVGRENFAAGTFTGGIPPGLIKIRHKQLVKASPVTHQVIIEAECGNEVPPNPPAFSSRLIPPGLGPTNASSKYRFWVSYRYVPSLDPAVISSIPLTALTTIYGAGPDSIAGAWEVTPSSVTSGFLQYRITAQSIAQNPMGEWDPTAEVTYPPSTPQDPNPLVTVGVTVNASNVIGPEGGAVKILDGNVEDGETELSVPAGLFTAPTEVTVDEIPISGDAGGFSLNPIIPPGLTDPIRVYRLDSQVPINGLVQVSLLYPDWEYPIGRNGIVDGRTTPVQNLTVLWYDGFAWRRGGGVVNTQNNTIVTKLSHLGFVAIAAAPPLSPEDRRPLQKIITPNNDGVNDTLDFLLTDVDTTVEIFDIGGHRVRSLHSQSQSAWDGRDDDGHIVESGVYIYQYDVDGKRINGVVAVAK